MITIFIGLLGAVILYVTAANGSWGAFGLCAFILLFLWLCASEERKDWDAYRNCREYWRRGGPMQNSGGVNVHTEVNVHTPPVRYVPPVRRTEPVARCFVCANCRKAEWAVGVPVLYGGEVATAYYCPECGKRGMIVR